MFRLHFAVHAAREGHYTSLPAEGAVVKLTDTDWLNWSTPGSTAAHNPDANPLLIESRHVACLASPEAKTLPPDIVIYKSLMRSK